MDKRLAKILIPVYRLPSEMEERSLKQCLRVLGNYPIVLVQPESFSSEPLTQMYPSLQIETFPDRYFNGLWGYNQLMLSASFYERFSDTKYVLIYQLDAFVFKDELKFWYDKNYDYIGAPWIASNPRSLGVRIDNFRKKIMHKENSRKEIFFKVGNGGFSLRKVSSFIRIAKKYQELIAENVDTESPNLEFIEDVFWGVKVPRLEPDFRVPDYQEAVAFAIDRKPQIALNLNQGLLPFGCHGYNKPKVAKFWEPILSKETE
ncbi:hypothetical protein FACS18947_6160 [Bacteroidia bacterium]|nr:hypothetical protein FACS18947_6160 [Bacteroidia bacterium]